MKNFNRRNCIFESLPYGKNSFMRGLIGVAKLLNSFSETLFVRTIILTSSNVVRTNFSLSQSFKSGVMLLSIKNLVRS